MCILLKKKTWQFFPPLSSSNVKARRLCLLCVTLPWNTCPHIFEGTPLSSPPPETHKCVWVLFWDSLQHPHCEHPVPSSCSVEPFLEQTLLCQRRNQCLLADGNHSCTCLSMTTFHCPLISTNFTDHHIAMMWKSYQMDFARHESPPVEYQHSFAENRNALWNKLVKIENILWLWIEQIYLQWLWAVR